MKTIDTEESNNMNQIILDTKELFKDFQHPWFICGGYALDMFAGEQLRTHGDFDISAFREHKVEMLQFLQSKGWNLYARFLDLNDADTHGTLYKVGDPIDSKWATCTNFWPVKGEDSFWRFVPHPKTEDAYTFQLNGDRTTGQIELNVIELEFNEQTDGYYLLDKPNISRIMDKAILYHNDIPYLAPEIVLFYKSDPWYATNASQKAKSLKDYENILPLLPEESKIWLQEAILTTYPNGDNWLAELF